MPLPPDVYSRAICYGPTSVHKSNETLYELEIRLLEGNSSYVTIKTRFEFCNKYVLLDAAEQFISIGSRSS